MIKRISTLILSGVMFFSASCFAAQGTSVVVNGQDFTNQVVLENGVIFAPYDKLAEAVGCSVDFDSEATGTIIVLSNEDYRILIPANGVQTGIYYTVKNYGKQTYESYSKELPATVKSENGTYLIPIRPICEILGITVDLDNELGGVDQNNIATKMVTKSQLEAEGKGPDSVNWRYQEDYLADKPIPESALIYKNPIAAQPTTNTTSEKMVTKSQLEAEGKGPDSVNWRYQEDYLANKPIPESALIYKNPIAVQPATNTTGEKMVTKSQLEAEGKGPDSVNWRYQEDYLANKPIPESALIYKQKNNTSNSANNTGNANENNNNGDGSVVESVSDYLISRYISGLETIGDAIGWIGNKLTK